MKVTAIITMGFMSLLTAKTPTAGDMLNLIEAINGDDPNNHFEIKEMLRLDEGKKYLLTVEAWKDGQHPSLSKATLNYEVRVEEVNIARPINLGKLSRF